MISDATMTVVLAFLHECFPTRDVTAATLDAYSFAFSDWTDEEFRDCAKRAAIELGRTFFPTPGEIAALRTIAPVDVAKVLRQISALGQNNPHGWIYPRIELVREELGDAIANAYAAAGAERCFADDGSVAQSVARTALAKELAATVRREGGHVLLGTPKARDERTLAAGDVQL